MNAHPRKLNEIQQYSQNMNLSKFYKVVKFLLTVFTSRYIFTYLWDQFLFCMLELSLNNVTQHLYSVSCSLRNFWFQKGSGRARRLPGPTRSNLCLRGFWIKTWKCTQSSVRLLSMLASAENPSAFPFHCRGHMPEWYTKSFGHLCAAEVVKIRDSFSNQNTETKDTKSRWLWKPSGCVHCPDVSFWTPFASPWKTGFWV